MRLAALCLILLVAPSMGIIAWKQFEGPGLGIASGTAAQPIHLRSRGEVLFFNASWCGPCRAMKPIVAQLRREGYRLRDIDVDQHRELVDRHRISGVPTFVFLENGAEVKRFSGGTSSDNLKKLCSSPAFH